MNLRKFSLIAMLVLVTVCGCDRFLEETPKATVVSDEFYSNENEIFQGLVGAYDVLGLENMYDLSLWRLGSGSADDLDWNTGALNIVLYEFGPEDAIFRDTWRELYNGINRANLLIANIPNAGDIAPETAARYTAEAKFIRALCYFNLVNLFGGVPLVKTPLSPQELKIPKNTVQEVYTLIEEDLKAGVEALPLRSEMGSDEVGRASKGAAQGLLAKVYLFQEKWPEAAEMANNVIMSGEYILLENFRDIFLLENENNSEIIFQVVFSSLGPQTGNGDANEGNNLSQWLRPVCKGGWGGSYPTEDLIQTFEPGDERFKATVIEEGDKVVEPGFRIVPEDYVLQSGESFNEGLGTLCPGWSKGWIRDGTVDAHLIPLDYIVLRLADVILIRAEALAENNQLNEAATELKKIRNRAELSDITVTTQQAMIDAVRHERRVELVSEPTRLYDLRRWGTVIETLKALGLPVQTNKHELFPIPQTEIDLHEGALEQNPGW